MPTKPEPLALDAEIRQLLLGLTDATSEELAARLLREGVGAVPGIVEVRIWLLRPGDRCKGCPLLPQCPDQSACLHLVPGLLPGAGDSAFLRLPIGVGVVGGVASDGAARLVSDIRSDPGWKRAADWARSEGVRGFGAFPLAHEGSIRGVMAVFLEEPATAASVATVEWVSRFAGVALAASANRQPRKVWTEKEVRAFERDNLVRALAASDGRIYGPGGAADRLGVRPTTLASRLKVLGIRRPASS